MRRESSEFGASSKGFHSSTSKPFAILKPVRTSPPPHRLLTSRIARTQEEISVAIDDLRDVVSRAECAAIDLETRGTRLEDPDTAIAGIGLAIRERGSCAGSTPWLLYVNWLAASIDQRREIMFILDELDGKLLAHNQLFDGGMLWRERRHVLRLGEEFGLEGREADDAAHLRFLACTYGAYKQLASEGWHGQSWGLKESQIDLLGWPYSNERELDDWLVRHGFATGGPKRRQARPPTKKHPEGFPEESESSWLARLYATWSAGGKVRPKKSEMWRAPAEILGRYCLLDCVSTLWLWELVLREPMYRFEELWRFHREVFLDNNRILIEQVWDGLRVDVDGFRRYRDELTARLEVLEAEIRAHPAIAGWVDEWEAAKRLEVIGEEPPRYKPFRLKEPKRVRKDGEISKAWLTWDERRRAHEANPPEYAAWHQWRARSTNAELLEKCRWSPSSADHVRDAVYREGGPIRWRDTGREGNNGHSTIEYLVPHPETGEEVVIEIERTNKGELPTGKKAMQQWGDIGRLLLRYKEEFKERGYVDGWLKLERNGRVHPTWASPGTVTLRLTGKSPNLQQCPKSIAFMQCVAPDPGHVWIEDDMCLHPDTECLTRTGWKKIADLREGEEIWQVDPVTSIGSWCVPSKVVRRQHDGELLKIGNIRGHLLVTPDHRMLWATQDGSRDLREFRPASDGVPNSSLSSMLIASQSEEEVSPHSEHEIWMACLLHQRAETETWWGIEFSSDLLTEDRTLSLSKLSTRHAHTLLEAVSFWGRSVTKGGSVSYSSRDERNVDELQAYFARSGYGTKKIVSLVNGSPHYYLRIYIRDRIRLRKGRDDQERVPYSGMVTCVRVPTSCFLVRYLGVPFVTGNCSVEPTVLAELTRDPVLMQVYGPEAKPNCAYLFFGAGLPNIGPKILATGYDPENPTKESVAKAKKEAKGARSVAKVVVLGKQYGMGWRTLQANLRLECGVFLTDDEAKELDRTWKRRLYISSVQFPKALEAERRANGGWFYDGLGHPVCVDEGYLKDIISRCVQRCAHSIHMLRVSITDRLLRERNVQHKWRVSDWHDQFIFEVPEDQAEVALEVVSRSYDVLNEELGGLIPIKGGPKISRNLAEAKEAEE